MALAASFRNIGSGGIGKAILGNPISLLTNGLFLYGADSMALRRAIPAVPLMKVGALLVHIESLYRMVCVGRLFGDSC